MLQSMSAGLQGSGLMPLHRPQAKGFANEERVTEHDGGENYHEEESARLETAIAELKQALEKDDVEAIKSKTQALSQATMKIGQAIYGKQGGDAGSSGASEEGQKKDENVYDAEYQEKKDDDKKQ